MLAFYDENQDAFAANPLRTFHDGTTGGPSEKKIYLRNSDAGKYYIDLVLSIDINEYDDQGVFGVSGWGTKLIVGERRPTEAEWNEQPSNTSIQLADIGDTLLADTSTYHPVWVRVFAPGGEAAQIRETTTLSLLYNERLVGA